MDFLQIVEWTTVVVTFLMIFSGIPPCISMYKTRETKDIPFLFFLVCFMNSVIGLYYGLMLDNTVLKVVNVVGTLLWAVYTLIYVFVTKHKVTAVLKVLIFCILFILQVYYLMYIVQIPKLIIEKLGRLLFLWSNVVAGVPSLQILDVLKAKSSAGIQVSLLTGGLLCSLTWLLYGYMIKDFNVYAPNILGSSVSVTLVVLFFAYRGGSKSKTD